MNRPAVLLLTLATVLSAPAVRAGDDVSAALKAASAVWPTARLSATGNPAPCPAEVIADTPASARNGLVQVRVRCTGTPGWTRYVPLRIEQTGLVAVLRAPLARGQTLSAATVDWQSRDVLRLPADVLLQGNPLASLSAKRDLPAGTVLAQSQLIAPKAIQRGQAVTLVSRAEGMEIRAPGEAMADAALGSRVPVRNRSSRRIVEGIARADGTVEVSL